MTENLKLNLENLYLILTIFLTKQILYQKNKFFNRILPEKMKIIKIKKNYKFLFNLYYKKCFIKSIKDSFNYIYNYNYCKKQCKKANLNVIFIYFKKLKKFFITNKIHFFVLKFLDLYEQYKLNVNNSNNNNYSNNNNIIVDNELNDLINNYESNISTNSIDNYFESLNKVKNILKETKKIEQNMKDFIKQIKK